MNNSELKNNRNKTTTYNFQAIYRSYLPAASVLLYPKGRKKLKDLVIYYIKCQTEKIKVGIYMVNHGGKGKDLVENYIKCQTGNTKVGIYMVNHGGKGNATNQGSVLRRSVKNINIFWVLRQRNKTIKQSELEYGTYLIKIYQEFKTILVSRSRPPQKSKEERSPSSKNNYTSINLSKQSRQKGCPPPRLQPCGRG